MARDIKAVYQDEFILGYQAMLDPAWSWGVNGTYRRMERALDDIRINHTPCGPTGSTLFPIGNPGESLTIWGDESIGCDSEGWITIDTSKDGYRELGSGEMIGYSIPNAPTRRWNSSSTAHGTRVGTSTPPICGPRARATSKVR